jgi:hypothetical protein
MVKAFEVEDSRKHRKPAASRKIANEIAMASSTESVKQRLAPSLAFRTSWFAGQSKNLS